MRLSCRPRQGLSILLRRKICMENAETEIRKEITAKRATPHSALRKAFSLAVNCLEINYEHAHTRL